MPHPHNKEIVEFRVLVVAAAALLFAAVLLRATSAGLSPEMFAQNRQSAPLFGDWAGVANYFAGALFLVIFGWAVVALFSFDYWQSKWV